VVTLTAFHKYGIIALAFHPHEPRLASVGLEDDHCVAVWKDVGGAWSKVTREATTKGDNNMVHFIVWARGGDGGEDSYPLVTGGVQHIRFWKLAGNSLASKKGNFGKIAQPQAQLCATNFAMDGEWRLVSGTSSGEILVWKGRDCILSRPAHDKTVNCMAAVGAVEGGNNAPPNAESSRLVTGGRDGKVKVWNSALESIHEYDITSFRNTVDPAVKSLDLIPAPTKNTKGLNIVRMLVGTQGAEVFELATDQRHFDASLPPLVQGHYQDELWGLDVLPSTDKTRGLVATSGDDGTVRVWSMDEKSMVCKYLLPRRRKLGKKKGTDAGKAGRAGVAMATPVGAPDEKDGARYMSRAVACDPAGKWLVVGLGGDVGKSKAERLGGHVVLSVEKDKQGKVELQLAATAEDLSEWISDVKWVPYDTPGKDGTSLYAIGSHDNNIYIYKSPPIGSNGGISKPAPVMKLTGHHSYIRHLDFSLPPNDDDPKVFLQSVCGAYELLFWELDTAALKAKQTKATLTRDADWATWTCILGWPVQGIWTGNMDGSDVNAVCRLDGTKPYLAVAGDDGKVKLYNYPCISTNAQSVVGSGHSSHVTNVRYPVIKGGNLPLTNRLITTGGNDKCVFQWRVDPI